MNDKQHLAALAQGDEQAATHLFNHYSAKVRLFIRFKFRFLAEDVDDIISETFLRFFRSVIKGQYRQDASIQTYLNRIAYREAIRFINTHKTEKQQRLLTDWQTFDSLFDTLFSNDDPEKSLIYQQCIDCLEHSLDQFISDARTVQTAKDCLTALTLKVEGRSIKEIAQTLQRSVAATKQLLYSGRQRLQPYLQVCQTLCLET